MGRCDSGSGVGAFPRSLLMIRNRTTATIPLAKGPTCNKNIRTEIETGVLVAFIVGILEWVGVHHSMPRLCYVSRHYLCVMAWLGVIRDVRSSMFRVPPSRGVG